MKGDGIMCEFCNMDTDEDIDSVRLLSSDMVEHGIFGNLYVNFSLDSLHETVYLDLTTDSGKSFSKKFQIKYCPFCGSRLGNRVREPQIAI